VYAEPIWEIHPSVPASAYPEPWGDNQPEDSSQEPTVVDLSYARNEEAQDSRGAEVFHQSLTISFGPL
jgi:hypothetical protein